MNATALPAVLLRELTSTAVWNATSAVPVNPDASCRDLHNANVTDTCLFVRAVDDCQIDEGLVNYLVTVYCHFSRFTLLGFVVLFVWWLLLFIGLAVAAEQFFVPALTVMAKTLRMSDSIAGVTFLAFGNGAPDIFSAIAAISNSKNGDNSLAFGALLGAGVFVTTAVAGCVILARPFRCMERPFLRDVIFYIVATFGAFYVTYDAQITAIEAACFILLYAAYVITVVAAGAIYRRQKSRLQRLDVNESAPADGPAIRTDDCQHCPSEHVQPSRSLQASGSSASSAEDQPLLGSHDRSSARACLRAFRKEINPIQKKEWTEKAVFGKLLLIGKALPRFVLTITVPVVDQSAPLDNWNRYLATLQCLLGPIVGIFLINQWQMTITGNFVLSELVLILSIVLAAIVWFVTSNEAPPKWHAAFAFFGFIVSILWIYSIANEIVNLLQMFGVALNISNAILGLTLLAWGNSLSDGIANTTTALKGFPRMGLAACFGGQFFNLVLGVGIPFTMLAIKTGEPISLTPFDFKLAILMGFLALSLIVNITVVPLVLRFEMTRRYAIVLIVIYVAFLVIALLTESNVIRVTF